MRDLAGIAEINGPNRAALAAERAANVLGKQQRDVILTRADHASRLAARRAVNNTPFPLFTRDETPDGAVTFVEGGEGLRSVPAPDHYNGEEAWYGEYREITSKGTKWHRVSNDAGNPISYTSPTYALHGARWAKDNAIEKAFH